MESGTFAGTAVKKGSTNKYAQGGGSFIRDVGGNCGPLCGRNRSVGSRLSEQRSEQRSEQCSQRRSQQHYQYPAHPQLELGGRILFWRGLRRRERTVGIGKQEPCACRRAAVAHG